MLTLAAREQSAIISCSDTLLRPFDYSSLDEWRAEVMRALSGLIDSEAAFFNFRNPPEGVRVAFSRDVSGALLDQYERHCEADKGFERAKEMRLTAMNQTMLVAGDWAGYNADPFVNAFYLPNKLLDSACLIVELPAAGLTATIEIHSSRFPAPAFGTRGLAVLRLLLPSFRAGISAVHQGACALGTLAELLTASHSAVAVFNAFGQCAFQTPRTEAVLTSDPERDHVLARMSQLARQAVATAHHAKSHDHPITPRCTTDIRTARATYHLEATRVSDFSFQGVDVLVSVERLQAVPLTDAALRASFRLTPREVSVARHIAAGASTPAIAAALAISIHTAKRHSEQVFVKLGVHTRSAVAAKLLS